VPQPAELTSDATIAEFQKMIVLGISPSDLSQPDEFDDDMSDPFQACNGAPEPDKPEALNEVEKALRDVPPQPVTWVAGSLKEERKTAAAAKKADAAAKKIEEQTAKAEKAAARKAAAESAAAKKAETQAAKAKAQAAAANPTSAPATYRRHVL
jgi:hypothetical protein